MEFKGSTSTVRDLLLARVDETSQPGARTDDAHVVLAVEGGGMRGAVSSGMLLALEQMGFRSAFDEVVGTSAGAIAGAFFVTGRGTAGSLLYYTVLNSERFLDRTRLIRQGSIMDLDYLIGEAMEAHGFRWEEVISSDIPLWATVSPVDPDDGQSMFRVARDAEHAKAVLTASAALPVIAGPSREVDGRLYIDGGMTEAVPWDAALRRGATHVLVARSRGYNRDYKPEELNPFERVTVPRLVRRMHGDYATEVVNRSAERFWNSTESLRAVIEGRSTPITAQGQAVAIDAVLPSAEADLPDRLELDTHVLMDALTDGARAMIEYLDLDGFGVEQRVVVTHPRAPVGRFRTDALAPIVRDRRHSPR